MTTFGNYPVLEFLQTFRKHAKAFKKAAGLRSEMLSIAGEAVNIAEDLVEYAENAAHASRSLQGYSEAESLEILRNAMGYAWEIGRGAPLVQELTAASENPFLDPDWAEAIVG